MKKIIVAATIAMSSLALVACSSQDSPTPTVTVTETAPAPVPVPVPDSTDDGTVNSSSDEELYLLSLKAMNNPILNVATDNQLLDMGYSVCDALNAGFTTDDVIEYMAGEMAANGMTSNAEVEAVGYIIGAAEIALCPSATF